MGLIDFGLDFLFEWVFVCLVILGITKGLSWLALGVETAWRFFLVCVGFPILLVLVSLCLVGFCLAGGVCLAVGVRDSFLEVRGRNFATN